MLPLLFLGVIKTSIAQNLTAFKQIQFSVKGQVQQGHVAPYLVHDLETHKLSALEFASGYQKSKFILKRDSAGNVFIVSMSNGAFFLHYEVSTNQISFKEYKSGDAKEPFIWNLLFGSSEENASLISPFLDSTKGLKVSNQEILIDDFKDSTGNNATSASNVSSAYVFIRNELAINKTQ